MSLDLSSLSKYMMLWMKDLFPICRSITGDGVRETLNYIKSIIPELEIKAVSTGTKAFDWEVPKEWNIYDAYIEDKTGKKIIDFKSNNLHVVGYSKSINQTMTYKDLDAHIHSLPNQPNAIPYITSYYNETWGFCVTDELRSELRKQPEKEFKVVINSSFKQGELNYGEVLIPGKSKKEVLLSTYICHPSMANNELSGPVMTMALINWIKNEQIDSRYSYRILFIPETIGSIVYLSKHYKSMIQNTVAGYVITCVGDNRDYSFIPSRNGNSLSDRVAKHVLQYHYPSFKEYTFLDREVMNDNIVAPGIDLPVASICRSKYGEYPEYHTSLDNLSLVSKEGLHGAFTVYTKCLTLINENSVYKSTVLGEPHLGKRGCIPQYQRKIHQILFVI